MSKVSDLLQQNQPGLPNQPSQTSKLLSQGDAALSQSLRAGRKQNPDLRAEVFRLQGRTGLPADVIQRNLDLVKQQAEAADFNAQNFRRDFPAMAGYMENPDNASISHDDMEAMQLLEGTTKLAQQRYKDNTTMGQRVWDRVREGWNGFRQAITALPFAETMARTSQGEEGNRVVATDPMTGMPIYASDVTATEEQQAKLSGATEAIGEGASIEFARRMAPLQAQAQQIEQRPATQAMFQAEDWGGVFEAFQMDPLGIIADIGISSTVQQIPALAAIIATRSPGVAVAASGGNAYALEMGNGITDYLASQQVDTTDPQAITEALADDATAKAAVEYAHQRGAIVGSVSALAGGVVSANLIPQSIIRSQAGREALNAFIGQPVTQGVIGSAGEAGAQLVTTGEINPGEVFAEGIGEFAGTPLEAGAFAVERLSNRAPKVVQEAASARNANDTLETMEALGEAARQSKTRERSSDRFREFAKRMSDEDGIENVQIPVDRWNELFQEAGEDPAEMANRVLGDRKQYEEATATGGDIVIPLDQYLDSLAASDFHEALSQNARFRSGDMTPAEAQQWSENASDIASSLIDETQQADPSQPVYDDIYGQLIGAGRDRSTADREAQITQAVFRTLGQRTGRDPNELFQSYNISVRRPLPEILQRAANDVDVDIDPLLDRLRSGDVPSQEDVFGQSLMDFVRERGIRDEGGELAARDIDVGRRAFQRAIIRDEGMSLDEAAQAAAEAGYIQGQDVGTVTQQDLLDAIDRELGGDPVFAAGAENTRQQNLLATLDELSRYLDDLGIDLATTDNASIRQAMDGFSTTQDEQATTLSQDGPEPRGRITFPQSRRFFNIELLEKANLSTYLHESGHLYLEIMTDLAQREDAPQQVRDDYQALLDWFGVEDADSIGTEQHEQFARGFEAYVMEGKAPSSELRATFARFRAWLTAIYRTIRNLNVNLTDQVREVMDRLVATDEEIEQARQESSYNAVFDRASVPGMTSAEFETYQRNVAEAKLEAEDAVTRQVMDEYQRTTKKWWKDARKTMRGQVADEVNQRPEYVAMSVLGRGKMPDGADLPEGMESFKLNRQALVDEYGAEFLKRLPRPYVYAKSGGVHPDAAAEVFGYRSGDAMIRAMVGARPRQQLIELETDQRMVAEYGDMLNDGGIAEAAAREVHRSKQEDVMQTELRILHRRSGGQQTPARVFREAASRIIAEKPVREVRPDRYQRAEQKAGREAFNAVARGDFQAAADQKQKQLLNYHLYREARKARDEVDSLLNYAGRLGRKAAQQRIGKAGGEYLEQINQLLNRYELRRVPLRQIDRRRSLEAWIQEQQAEGYTVDVPDAVMNDARVINYREVPVEELRGIHDALRQINHLSKTKNQMLASADKRDFNERVDEVVASIDSVRNRTTGAPPLHEDWKDKLATWAKEAHGWHTKPEFLFRWLDGDAEYGTAWQALFKPVADAEVAEQELQTQLTGRLGEIMSAYTRKERASWYAKGPYIPEVGQNVPKTAQLAMALNWGNEYNRQVLMETYTERQVNAVLGRLDQRDWETVQSIWDLIDTMWPQIEQLEKDLNGVAPQKVEGIPFDPPGLPAGTIRMRGGYYPIKYDSRVSAKTFRREEQSGQQLFEDSFSKPATRRGHTKERQGSGGQKLRLDINVLSEHLSQAAHDITHRRAIIDVNRLSENSQVREAIEQTAGREMYRQIRPWLQAVANEVKQPESYWEKLVGRARVGGTVVNMGLKATTALAQPLGLFSSMDILGTKYTWRGLMDFLGPRGGDRGMIWSHMRKNVDFVMERSPMMQDRQRTYDRDVRDTLGRLTKESRMQEMGRFYFYFTGMLDMAVSVPTWLGAYRKAMEGEVGNIESGSEVDAIAYADSIVRQSQSSGGIKDLARIQRGGQVQRAFTMFYSYFSVLYNQSARRISQVKNKEIGLPQLAASAMFLWIVPALLGELVAGRGPDDDEDWANWAAINLAGYPAGAVVGLRDVSNAILTPYGFDASPAYDAFSTTARTARIPWKMLDPEQEVTRADVKSAVLAAGYWAALPSRQAWITGEYLYDVATGEADPETPQEFVKGLFFTRPADER